MQINTLKYFKTISFFTYFPRPELGFMLLLKEFPSFLLQAAGPGLTQGTPGLLTEGKSRTRTQAWKELQDLLNVQLQVFRIWLQQEGSKC